jgi:hypothetical protein
LNIERQGSKIGYIPGPGDEVPAALRQIGYEVTLIGDEMLASLVPGSSTLARFDAIVIGVRAYNTNETLRLAQPALMAYVRGRRHAGRAVQHQQSARPADDTHRTLSLRDWPRARDGRKRRRRISSARSTHPQFAPNRITERDFDGWVQERGLYFASTWDPRYQAVLSMGDPGESALAGGHPVGAPRQGRLHLHGPRLLPPVASGRSGRLPPVRQSPGRGTGTNAR